jgi:thioredoxin 2
MAAPSNVQIISCPKCGAKNRVVLQKQTGREAICGRCKTPLSAESNPVIVTDQNFVEEVERSPLPVLLDLWAAWCGPCRIIAPIIDQLARELSGRARVAKLNIDQNPSTTARFGVQSIPTLLVLKNGREVDRLIGVQSSEAILRKIQPYL